MRLRAVLLLFSICAADRPSDLVDQIPGFERAAFKIYSGLLDVPGPISSYDSLRIHYQFHTSQNSPSEDPVAVWHQGGPGGSSIVGAYSEMGYFQVSGNSTYNNPWAWNRVANMLYLESPAGSGQEYGFSQCVKGAKPVSCSWDDVTQAEAYAHTLHAFFKAFPEYASNDLFLTGESYFGQYGPNIAHFILNNEPFKTSLKNLKGLALGNACWGGNATHFDCNGPNKVQNDVELFFGKGLFSKNLHTEIYKACDFPHTGSPQCGLKLQEMRRQVGPHNIYDIYDNCPHTESFLERTGKDMGWLIDYLRTGMADPVGTHKSLLDMSGGYPYACKSMGEISKWLVRPDVRKALNLDSVEPGASQFKYRMSGPASITLYPELAKKLRILIYNGDADACVPYIGNEEWIGDLESRGVLEVLSPWTPWYTSNRVTPAGYITRYTVPGSDKDFTFMTVRLAGHMVPSFRPGAAFDLFSRFVAGGKAVGEEKLLVV